jgi:hypothetical protein
MVDLDGDVRVLLKVVRLRALIPGPVTITGTAIHSDSDGGRPQCTSLSLCLYVSVGCVSAAAYAKHFAEAAAPNHSEQLVPACQWLPSAVHR